MSNFIDFIQLAQLFYQLLNRVELLFIILVYIKEQNVLSDLLLSIAALTVRHEFCVQVEEADGLKSIFNCMVKRKEIISQFSLHFYMFSKDFMILSIAERTFKLNAGIKRCVEIATRFGWRRYS